MFVKIGEAIRLLIQHFPLFSLIILTVWLPGAILIHGFSFSALSSLSEIDRLRQEVLLTSLVELIFGPIYIGALIHALAKLKQGQQPAYAEVIRASFQTWGKLFVTRLVANLFVSGALLLLIVPGVILATQYALIDSIVTLEQRSGEDARSHSRFLTQGRRWEIFGAGFFTSVGTFVVLTLVVALLGSDNLFLTIVTECINSIVFALLIIVLFLYYWDARNADRSLG